MIDGTDGKNRFMTAAAKHRSQLPTMWCKKCWYVLDGLPESRCPECGVEFDPTDASTFNANLASFRFTTKTTAATIVLLALFILVWARSYWVSDTVTRVYSIHRTWLVSRSGTVSLVRGLSITGLHPGWDIESIPSERIHLGPSLWNAMGFRIYWSPNYKELTFPHWSFVPVLALPVVIRLRRWNRVRRLRSDIG
jgi:hypothetical protein